ncbi:Platinum sensitivity protein [Thecaphora frezii]
MGWEGDEHFPAEARKAEGAVLAHAERHEGSPEPATAAATGEGQDTSKDASEVDRVLGSEAEGGGAQEGEFGASAAGPPLGATSSDALEVTDAQRGASPMADGSEAAAAAAALPQPMLATTTSSEVGLVQPHTASTPQQMQGVVSGPMSSAADGLVGVTLHGTGEADLRAQHDDTSPRQQALELDEYAAAGNGTMPSMLASSTIPLEEDALGDLSTSSSETLTLTSTVSRGNYHQCGSARRVKVYELKGENWYDRGTGYCAGVYDETVDEALLVARKEDKCQFLDGVDIQGDLDDDGSLDSLDGDGLKERPCQFVVVVSENLDTDDVLLASKVVREEVYQRQQETLVVWTEPGGADMALSFQEPEGCNEVWEFLTEVQKHFARLAEEAMVSMPPPKPNPQMPPGALGVSGSSFSMESFVSHDGHFVGLPDPELRNLDAIEMMLKEAATRSPVMREKVAIWLLREHYIKKLIPVFEDAEELEALPSLHLLCLIMQTILMLNDNVIFEYVLQDDIFLGVVGMLEYDPEFPRLKASYRDYLRDRARFKQVVEIADPMIVAKIHQTYRLLYLKDVILARVLDDPTFSILNSFVFFHQSDIVNYCGQNEAFLSQLFGLLGSPEESDERKSEGVLFLQQLCAMGKQIQLPARLALFRTLTERGLLQVVQFALDRLDQHVRNAAAEILMTIIEYDANGVRSHVVGQVDHGERPLISMLIDLLHSEQDLGLKAQMAEAMRIIFDVGEGGPMAAQAQLMGSVVNSKVKADSDRFLTWIYEAEIGRLCSPFNALPDVRVLSKGEKLPSQPRPRSALYSHLCDLLCYMIVHHTFRSQYFILTSEISKKVGSLLHSREKHIRLSALRFFKHCLASNNQFTNRHFIKIELFSTILGLVESEAERNNLICSACLDFFEQMRKANMKQLINHCMERHGPRLRHLANSPHVGACFSAIVSQWEKSAEPVGAVPDDAAAAAQAQAEEKARQQRDLARRGAVRTDIDSDEESYFNTEDDDEEDTASHATNAPAPSTTTTMVGLVPYEEDDDDVDVDVEADPKAAQVSTPGSPPKLLEKRRREEEEEEEEDMVGRLAKRPHGKQKPQKADGDAAEADNGGDAPAPGGFIRNVANTLSSTFGVGNNGRGRSNNSVGSGSSSPTAAESPTTGSASIKGHKPKNNATGNVSSTTEVGGKGTSEGGKRGNGLGGTGTGGGIKKISLGLSSSSKKMAAQSSAADEGTEEGGKRKK